MRGNVHSNKLSEVLTAVWDLAMAFIRKQINALPGLLCE